MTCEFLFGFVWNLNLQLSFCVCVLNVRRLFLFLRLGAFGRNYSLDLIDKIPNSMDYNTFAYHTPLLKEFVNAEAGIGAKRRASKNSGDHTNPRVMRRGTFMADKVATRTGSLRDLTTRSDGDEPKKQGSFRRMLNGSHQGPRARRSTFASK